MRSVFSHFSTPMFIQTVCVCMLVVTAGCTKREIADGTVVSVIYSSDVRGKLEGCGCKHNGGGITKRSAKIKAARAEDSSVLYCDAGNFLSGTAEVDSTRGKLSVEAYNYVGASVVNVSERELAFGLDVFREIKSASKFDYVSANVLVRGSAVAEPFVIKEIKDARVAFFGLCGTKNTMRFDSLKLPEGSEITDPVAATRKTMDALAGRAELIILLSTCGDATDSLLAQMFPEIQLIIGGRSFRPNSAEPWKIGETRVVRADRDGRTLGRMDMVFGPKKEIKMYNPATVSMETSDPSDPQMLELVRRFVPTFTDNPTEGVRIVQAATSTAPH
jgi:2',3'-cyclic-nucleotide 2'-phosphodiesterase (5'-nucleotidase family)